MDKSRDQDQGKGAMEQDQQNQGGNSKYPPAEPEALRVAGPSKGPCRDPKSKSQASGHNAGGRGV